MKFPRASFTGGRMRSASRLGPDAVLISALQNQTRTVTGGSSPLLGRSRQAAQVRSPGRSQRAKPPALADGLVDLGAVAPFVRRQRHHCLVDISIERQRAVQRRKAALALQSYLPST